MPYFIQVMREYLSKVSTCPAVVLCPWSAEAHWGPAQFAQPTQAAIGRVLLPSGLSGFLANINFF